MKRLLVVLAVLACASAVADEDAQSTAKALSNEGSNAYDLGNYDAAIEHFSAAYRAYPDARILFNLAQSYRKKGEYARALDLYRAYLRNAPDTPFRPKVEGLIAETEDLVARQKTEPPRPQPGSTTLPELPTIVTRIEEPRPWYGNVSGWALAGGGAVATGVGLGFFVSASSLDDQLAVAPESQRPGLRSDITTRRTVGTVLCVVGGLAVAGGVTIFVLAPRTVTRDIVPIRDLRLSLAPSQVALSWRF
jgi:tetratricopeptide (TPR) repeat protein